MRHQWFSEAEVRAMIGNGTLADAHSVAAWAVLDLSRVGQSDRRPA
jgi:ornithine cyclodeaminase/alanine dehydrogenase-like protein (mu-crystallin family)